MCRSCVPVLQQPLLFPSVGAGVLKRAHTYHVAYPNNSSPSAPAPTTAAVQSSPFSPSPTPRTLGPNQSRVTPQEDGNQPGGPSTGAITSLLATSAPPAIPSASQSFTPPIVASTAVCGEYTLIPSCVRRSRLSCCESAKVRDLRGRNIIGSVGG